MHSRDTRGSAAIGPLVGSLSASMRRAVFTSAMLAPIALACSSTAGTPNPTCCRGPSVMFTMGSAQGLGPTICACSSTQVMDAGSNVASDISTVVVFSDGTPASVLDSGFIDHTCMQLNRATGCSVIAGARIDFTDGTTQQTQSLEICGGTAVTSCP
jgi:hypothetical protein